MTNNNFIAVSNICQTITFRKRYHDSKEMKTMKLSEQSFCLHSCTKNCTGVFPIANNRDYSAFRTLSFVPLCRLHSDLIATKFLVRLNHKLVSFETFSGIFFFS